MVHPWEPGLEGKHTKHDRAVQVLSDVSAFLPSLQRGKSHSAVILRTLSASSPRSWVLLFCFFFLVSHVTLFSPPRSRLCGNKDTRLLRLGSEEPTVERKRLIIVATRITVLVEAELT